MTPEQHAEWSAAYAAELAGPEPDEGMVLRHAAERTAHLWGVRIAPDGQVVLNPAQLDPQVYAEMEAARDNRSRKPNRRSDDHAPPDPGGDRAV